MLLESLQFHSHNLFVAEDLRFDAVNENEIDEAKTRGKREQKLLKGISIVLSIVCPSEWNLL